MRFSLVALAVLGQVLHPSMHLTASIDAIPASTDAPSASMNAIR
jgi:hypothetical protein